MLCKNFAEYSVVLEYQSRPIGFVTAYRLPDRPDTLIIWQATVEYSINPENFHMVSHNQNIADRLGTGFELKPFLSAS